MAGPAGAGGDGDGGRRSAGSTDWFAVLPGVKLPDMVDSRSLDTSVTLDQCRARCLANCSCVAYAAADIRSRRRRRHRMPHVGRKPH